MRIDKEHSAVILRVPLRSPLGSKRSPMGKMNSADLLGQVIEEVVTSAGIDPENIDCGYLGGTALCGRNGALQLGRLAVISGLQDKGKHISVVTESMLCGTSAKTTDSGANAVIVGGNRKHSKRIAIVGGVDNYNEKYFPVGSDMVPPQVNPENKKHVKRTIRNSVLKGIGGIFKGQGFKVDMPKLLAELIRPSLPRGLKKFTPMGPSGDWLAEKYKISKKRCNEFGELSHARMTDAVNRGRLKSQIVTIDTGAGYVDTDDCYRDTTTKTGLEKLRASFGRFGIHTPGTSSQDGVGACALLVANEARAEDLKLQPMARFIACAETAGDYGLGQLEQPLFAIPHVLELAGLSIEDIDLWEINEAFAAEVLFLLDELGIDINKVNVNGGAIAIGHPYGASGARLQCTLLHEMDRRAKEIQLSGSNEEIPKYGLAVLCVGLWQGIAEVFEYIPDQTIKPIN